MRQGKQRWLWALLPSMLVLGATAHAQQYERYDDGYNSGPVRCESNKNRTQQCPLDGRARWCGRFPARRASKARPGARHAMACG